MFRETEMQDLIAASRQLAWLYRAVTAVWAMVVGNLVCLLYLTFGKPWRLSPSQLSTVTSVAAFTFVALVAAALFVNHRIRLKEEEMYGSDE